MVKKCNIEKCNKCEKCYLNDPNKYYQFLDKRYPLLQNALYNMCVKKCQDLSNCYKKLKELVNKFGDSISFKSFKFNDKEKTISINLTEKVNHDLISSIFELLKIEYNVDSMKIRFVGYDEKKYLICFFCHILTYLIHKRTELPCCNMNPLCCDYGRKPINETCFYCYDCK